jgi:hypothetical protein
MMDGRRVGARTAARHAVCGDPERLLMDRQAAFDVAMSDLEYFPLHAEARELAEASTADDDEPRLASAAAAFLDACGHDPGFEVAPERLARLERALDAVRADMRATGLSGEIRLVRLHRDPRATVETWARDHGWDAGIFPSQAPTQLSPVLPAALRGSQDPCDHCAPFAAHNRFITQGAPCPARGRSDDFGARAVHDDYADLHACR